VRFGVTDPHLAIMRNSQPALKQFFSTTGMEYSQYDPVITGRATERQAAAGARS